MRLIKTLKDQKLAIDLSHYLENAGIANQLDINTNTDWGSSEYGDSICNLWIIEEDQVEPALEKMQSFLENPEKESEKNAALIRKIWLHEKPEPQTDSKVVMQERKRVKDEGFGTITTAILIICTLLLMIGTLTAPKINQEDTLVSNVLVTPKINKLLMFDYPHAYEIVDSIINAYGIESLKNKEEMPAAEQKLIQTFYDTPFWKGFYDKLTQYLTNPELPVRFDAPMFEKIRQGEFWRLLTPIFLHYDIIHLFFNMIWLIVIGKQIEERLGPMRYILFIVFAGIFSNTLQYLMAGANFVGFSGVLCAMLAFIWVRQKRAAWEGYQLQSSTLVFITLFIVAMFTIQLVSFFLEIYTQKAFSLGIANTAHLTGALIGAFFGRLDYFAYKNR